MISDLLNGASLVLFRIAWMSLQPRDGTLDTLVKKGTLFQFPTSQATSLRNLLEIFRHSLMHESSACVFDREQKRQTRHTPCKTFIRCRTAEVIGTTLHQINSFCRPNRRRIGARIWAAQTPRQSRCQLPT